MLGAAGSATAQSLQSSGWDADVRLSEAADTNPDPRVVEVYLEARVADVEIEKGVRVQAWTYNGGIPGPLIRVSVGDRLIVHFVNRLPRPTTVHWHGMRVSIEMDGVPGISQPEVRTGESFTYDFKVPDAGLYWYHPHVMSAAQVGFGLYGALLVEDPAEHVAVADELVLVVSDIGIDEKGVLDSPDSGGSTGMAFGREGNHLLVNGHKNSRLTVRSGAPQRWRIVNAAKSRYFDLDLGGTLFTTIGVDGGLQEYSVDSDSLVLAPGERADVIVTPRAAPGTELTLQSRLYNRGYGSVEARVPFDDLMTIAVADSPVYSGPGVAPIRRSIVPLSTAGAREVKLDLTIGQLRDGSFEYAINGLPFPETKPVVASSGETQVWTLTNKTKWSHPFHLHGFFFQALDEKGNPVHPLAWKDTVDVPFERSARVVVRFDEGHEGTWMYHCHVLDHAEGGLMGTVHVGDGTAAAVHTGHTLSLKP